MVDRAHAAVTDEPRDRELNEQLGVTTVPPAKRYASGTGSVSDCIP